MPRFSIVVPCYNNEDTVDEAIESALAQRFDDYAVFVCDNASKDGSADRIARYRSPRLKTLLSDQALPKTENWNRAYCGAPDAEYLVTLHADDRLDPDCLTHLAAAAQYRPALIHGGCRSIGYDGSFVRRTQFNFAYRASRDVFHEILRLSNVVAVPGATMRSDAFHSIGLFPPEWTYLQDTEAWWRLVDYGPAAYVPQVIGDYRLEFKVPRSPVPLMTELVRWQISKLDSASTEWQHRASVAGLASALFQVAATPYEDDAPGATKLKEAVTDATARLDGFPVSDRPARNWQRRTRLLAAAVSFFR